jgi:hypothetical protein
VTKQLTRSKNFKDKMKKEVKQRPNLEGLRLKELRQKGKNKKRNN